MSLGQKLRLAVRIWSEALMLRLRLRMHPLPKVVDLFNKVDHPTPRSTTRPEQLGKIVYRVLTVADRPPRCLISAMVAYRLLRQEGYPVELVIGLPDEAIDQDAHAWLELNGRDIGPPPGQAGHVELARYR